MPLTVLADLASVLSTQLRMSAAIGYMYGHDTHSDEVRTFCYLCLAGNGAREVLAQVGVQIGNSVAKKFIMQKITGETLKRINRAVGMRLVTKAGEKGVINLVKAVPPFGAGVNLTSNVVVARTARRVFRAEQPKRSRETRSAALAVGVVPQARA